MEPVIVIAHKTCRACGEERLRDQFPKAKSNRDGHMNLCHVCNRAKARSWQKANPERERRKYVRWRSANGERVRRVTREYYEANRERLIRESVERNRANPEGRRATQRRYYEANREEIVEKNRQRSLQRDPERRRELQRAWKARNRDKVAADNHRRRAERYDEDGLAMLGIIHADPCAYCGKAASEVDHIVPLSDGGQNAWDNLAAACRTCNSSKNDRPLLLWMLHAA